MVAGASFLELNAYLIRIFSVSRQTNQPLFVSLWIKQLNWRTRHNGRNRVFIDQLRLGLAAKQQTEIVEPRYNALQLYTIDQKDGHWNFVFPDIVEE